MLLLVATVALLAPGASADLYNCKSQKIAVGPNGYQMQTSTFAPNQNCILQFTWPQDHYYATLTMEIVGHAWTDSITFFSIEEDGRSLNQSVRVNWQYTNPNLTISWPPDTVSLNITIGNTTELSFNLTVTAHTFSVENAPTTTLRPLKGAQPFYIPFSMLSKNYAFSVESNDQVYAQCMGAMMDETALTNFFLYEGTGKSLKLIGSLYMTIDAVNYLYNTNFTVYSAANVNTDGIIFINNNLNNPDFFNFIYGFGDTFQLNDYEGVDETSGCTMAHKGGVYLESITTRNTVPLKLLIGGPIGESNSTLLTTYGEGIINQLPQFIPGGAWTFLASHVDNWSVKLISSNSTKSMLAYNKQSGFIMSDNYPFLSVPQNSQPFQMISGDQGPFTIAFTVATNSPNKDATVVIDTGSGNPTTINLNTITVPYTRAFTTKTVSLVINGGWQPSNGTYISYTVASTFNRPPQ